MSSRSTYPRCASTSSAAATCSRPARRSPWPRSRCGRRSSPRSSSTPPATSASTTRSPRASTGRIPVLPWIVFFQNVDAIIGPEEPIIYPEALTNELDYELELAVIIGKAGKFFSPEEAADYIAGYIVFNDITARDIQREEMKSGRVLPVQEHRHVRADRPVDRHRRRDPRSAEPRDGAAGQRLRAARSRTPAACRSPSPRSSATIRRWATAPATSSPPAPCPAWPASREDAASLYLKPGDVVEAEIEGVGVLRNPVISWAEGHPESTPLAVEHA